MDGRTTVEQLGARTGTPASTVRRRLETLRRSGVLYLDVEFDTRRVDAGMPTLVWLAVRPADLALAGRQLAELPATAFAAAVTGPHNIHAVLVTGSSTELYEVLSGPVAELPGLASLVSAPVLRSLKSGGPLAVPS